MLKICLLLFLSVALFEVQAEDDAAVNHVKNHGHPHKRQLGSANEDQIEAHRPPNLAGAVLLGEHNKRNLESDDQNDPINGAPEFPHDLHDNKRLREHHRRELGSAVGNDKMYRPRPHQLPDAMLLGENHRRELGSEDAAFPEHPRFPHNPNDILKENRRPEFQNDFQQQRDQRKRALEP